MMKCWDSSSFIFYFPLFIYKTFFLSLLATNHPVRIDPFPLFFPFFFVIALYTFIYTLSLYMYISYKTACSSSSWRAAIDVVYPPPRLRLSRYLTLWVSGRIQSSLMFESKKRMRGVACLTSWRCPDTGQVDGGKTLFFSFFFFANVLEVFFFSFSCQNRQEPHFFLPLLPAEKYIFKIVVLLLYFLLLFNRGRCAFFLLSARTQKLPVNRRRGHCLTISRFKCTVYISLSLFVVG